MPRCSRRHAAPRPVGPAPMMRCRTFTCGMRRLAAMEDERIAERRVRLVWHGGPLGARSEEFAEGARLPFAWMSTVMEPVVEEQHRAVLKRRSDGGQRVARRFVEIAV